VAVQADAATLGTRGRQAAMRPAAAGVRHCNTLCANVFYAQIAFLGGPMFGHRSYLAGQGRRNLDVASCHGHERFRMRTAREERMHKRVPPEQLAYKARPRAEAAMCDVRERVLTPGAFLVVGVTFAAYLLSALYLGSRGGISYFGADPEFYQVLERHLQHDTATRFHPATVVLGLGWMKLFSPIEIWVAPHILLKAMFAAVGAVGVLGAIIAFTVLLPRGYGLIGGIIYASSLGVWYFAAIPESKILTATLSALYIAVYARYRDDWNERRTIGLNAILAMACFNEIVAGFLVAIPAVDALLRGINWPRIRWIGLQVAVGLIALLVLELVVNGWVVPKSGSPAEQSHFALFLHYVLKFKYGLAKFHDFFANWFLFNLVAPTPQALWWPQTGGYFEPSVAAYRGSPIALVALFIISMMIVVASLPGMRAASFGAADGLLLPLAAFAIIRAAFFVVFVPDEALLFSPSVTLAHWLILLVPFAASRVPAKGWVLAVLAICLIAANTGFILGRDVWTVGAALWSGA
jgi:hypothetical protein